MTHKMTTTLQPIETPRNKTLNMKRVAIYCRVSTKDQDCARQESELTALAERSGYEVVGVFKETASGSSRDRPIRKQVLDMVNKRLIDVVLVSELSRWGRSTTDLLDTIESIFSKGCSLIPLQGLTFDPSGSMGKLLLTLFSALAEFERNQLIERTLSGLEEAKRRGKKLGRPPEWNKFRKYGQQIVELKEQGLSVRDIAKELKISPTTVQKAINALRP